MAKGKKGKKSKKKEEDKAVKILEYELITIEDNFKEELNQNTRISAENFQSGLKEKDIIDEWLSYVNCDHIPKAFIPNSIRDFFYKQLYINEEIIKESSNWLLSINERSILTQDIDAVNLTKRHFLNLKDTDIGAQYELLIRDDLELLERMFKVLNAKIKDLPSHILIDIQLLESECKQLMKDFFNEYTYRVLCFHDATLEYINSHTDQYFFSTKELQIYIWARKDFEITFEHDHPPHVLVPVKNMDLFVHIPLHVVVSNRVLRCLHLIYDHYSNLTKSFKTIKQSTDSVDCNDFIGILKNEWKIMRNIQKEVWQKLKSQREAYDEYIKQKELENESKKNKKAQKDNKKGKPKKDKKWPKEPAVITTNTLPVVHKDFLIEEENLYQAFLNNTDPINFQLEPLEINLRQYELKGGIFEIFVVTKPKTTVYPTRIMTWHYKNSILQYKNIKCDKTDENLDKMYLVTFILPEHLVRWKVPLICQWEDAQKINYDTFQEPSTKYSMLKKVCVLKDFQVNRLLTRDEKYDVVRHAVPRIISSYKFEMERQMDNPEDEVKTIKRAVDKAAKTDGELDSELVAFKWKNPERLFPIIHPYQPLQLLSHEIELDVLSVNGFEDNGPKLLFSHVIDEFDTYKSKLNTSQLISKVNDEKEERKKLSLTSVLSGRRKGSRASLRKSLKPNALDEMHLTDQSERKNKFHRRLSSSAALKHVEQEFVEEEEGVEEEDEMDIEPKWTTKHIFETKYEPESRKITVRTDRLGTFAWAFDTYVHFPYKKWRLERDKREKEETILFFLETQFITIFLWISHTSFHGQVTTWMEDQGKYKTLLKFDSIKNFQQLKELFLENHFNIFPQEDAFWYIEEKESFSVKHTALENHTYDCMAYTCTSIGYDHSVWNFLSSRRTIVIDMKCDEDQYTLKITPENVLIVEIKELCNMLEAVDLQYTPTWKNIDFTPDLLSLINSHYSYLPKVTNPHLFVSLASLLKGIRFLSYS